MSLFPFVSLIMPTRGRPELAAISLAHALTQDYDPARFEILVFDDDDFPSFTEPPTTPVRREPTQVPAPAFPLLRYFRNPRDQFRTLGDKRNAMCEEAHGEIIAHLDSDDLSAPHRISAQANILMSHYAVSIVGFHTLPFYDISTDLAYVYHLNSACVCGTSLVYRHDFWRTHPFPSTDIGEDLPYTVANREHRIAVSGEDLLVALLHDDNMSSRQQVRNHPQCFPRLPVDSLPTWFYVELHRWQALMDCDNVAEISNETFNSTPA